MGTQQGLWYDVIGVIISIILVKLPPINLKKKSAEYKNSLQLNKNNIYKANDSGT